MQILGFKGKLIGLCKEIQKLVFQALVYNNIIFISYIKYTNITLPANSKANRGRWCVDGLRFITIVEVKKDHIYNRSNSNICSNEGLTLLRIVISQVIAFLIEPC